MPDHIHLSLSQALPGICSWHPVGTQSLLQLAPCFVAASLSFLLSISLLFTPLYPHLLSSSALSSISPASQLPILRCQIREEKAPTDRNPKLIYKQWCRSCADRTVFIQYEGIGSDASEPPPGRECDHAIFVIIGRDLDPSLSLSVSLGLNKCCRKNPRDKSKPTAMDIGNEELSGLYYAWLDRTLHTVFWKVFRRQLCPSCSLLLSLPPLLPSTHDSPQLHGLIGLQQHRF